MTKIRVSANPHLSPVTPGQFIPTTKIELIMDTELLEDGQAFLIQQKPDGTWGVLKDGKHRLYTVVLDK